MHISLNPEGDISLHQGEQYDLPEDNPHIKTLAAMKYLVPVAEVSEEKKITNPKKTTKL
jgi:hypothetical protein